MATQTIAVAGKGGVGKTTLCGFIIDYLCRKHNGPVLAVDADANSNLNEVLGVDVELTLGDLREEIAKADIVKDSPIPASMSKKDYLDYKFNSAMVEADDFDMLVMGRTQGSGSCDGKNAGKRMLLLCKWTSSGTDREGVGQLPLCGGG